MVNPSDDPERAYNYVCASAIGWVDTVSPLLNSEFARLQNKAYDQLRSQQSGGGSSSGGSYGGNNNNYGSQQQTVTRTESSGDNFNF